MGKIQTTIINNGEVRTESQQIFRPPTLLLLGLMGTPSRGDGSSRISFIFPRTHTVLMASLRLWCGGLNIYLSFFPLCCCSIRGPVSSSAFSLWEGAPRTPTRTNHTYLIERKTRFGVYPLRRLEDIGWQKGEGEKMTTSLPLSNRGQNDGRLSGAHEAGYRYPGAKRSVF